MKFAEGVALRRFGMQSSTVSRKYVYEDGISGRAAAKDLVIDQADADILGGFAKCETVRFRDKLDMDTVQSQAVNGLAAAASLGHEPSIAKIEAARARRQAAQVEVPAGNGQSQPAAARK